MIKIMPILMPILRPIARQLLSAIIPSRCLLCGQVHEGSFILICAGCYHDLPHIRHACERCGLPIFEASARSISQANTCGSCLKNPPPFRRAIAPLLYAPPIDRRVAAFKYNQQLISGQLLSQLLLQSIQRHYQNQALPDLIIPVPLHWSRLLKRGYNQSLCIAQYLACELQIPIGKNHLLRHRRTLSQQGLTRQERQHNLINAFTLKKPLAGETIALIDDVMTTGATAAEITRTLKRAGAGAVDVWTLARTPSPNAF